MCLKRVAFVGEVAHMGLVRLGLITVVDNRTLCVWIIHGGCKPNDAVKRVTFVTQGGPAIFIPVPAASGCLATCFAI